VAGADSSEAVAGLGALLLGGLKALHVYSSTGQGRGMGRHARGPVQAVWHARHELLTDAQRKQLEGFSASSKNFAALLSQRSPSPEPVRREYVPAPRQQPQPRRERKRSAAEEQAEAEAQAAAEPEYLSRRQQRRMQAQQRAEEAAASRPQQGPAVLAAQQQAAPAAKQYKLSFKFGTNLTGMMGAEAPEPQAQQQPAAPGWQPPSQPPLPSQGFQASPPPAGPQEPQPPLPPGDWGAVGDPPLSPMSGPPSPAAMAAAGTANGGAQPLHPGLNPEALEHAASGSQAIRDLLG
jgi:hypothetical protein